MHSRVSYGAYFLLNMNLELVWHMAVLRDSGEMLYIW